MVYDSGDVSLLSPYRPADVAFCLFQSISPSQFGAFGAQFLQLIAYGLLLPLSTLNATRRRMSPKTEYQ